MTDIPFAHARDSHRFISVAALMLIALGCGAAQAADPYPSRPVRLVVAFAPGGPNDVLARVLAQRLSLDTGSQFVVENKPGAGGIIGTDAVAKAAPDGYTLLFNSGPFTMSPALQAKMPYDTEGDFTPITRVGQSPMVLQVPPTSPHKTVKQLVDFARANPGKLTYGSGGIGSTPHLTTEQFAMVTGIKLLHVPYKGGGQSIQALMAGEVDILLDSITSSIGFISSGRVVPLALGRATRMAKFPNIPTFAEAGVSGFNTIHWVGVVAPRKVPAEVAAKLHADILKALASEDIKTRFADIGAEPVGDSPEDFRSFMHNEIIGWAKVARAAKMQVQ
ncbi:MAG TPA: tripartite tricarboxylate transporter substrate binding protein [Burkholderiales bacterium]|nr:tripartite tricarboxylate transporter substrate binding protein [Burkholderiales bacterium]